MGFTAPIPPLIKNIFFSVPMARGPIAAKSEAIGHVSFPLIAKISPDDNKIIARFPF
jgi:hypothetical protein